MQSRASFVQDASYVKRCREKAWRSRRAPHFSISFDKSGTWTRLNGYTCHLRASAHSQSSSSFHLMPLMYALYTVEPWNRFDPQQDGFNSSCRLNSGTDFVQAILSRAGYSLTLCVYCMRRECKTSFVTGTLCCVRYLFYPATAMNPSFSFEQLTHRLVWCDQCCRCCTFWRETPPVHVACYRSLVGCFAIFRALVLKCPYDVRRDGRLNGL